MIENSDDVEKKGELTISYFRLNDHIKKIIQTNYKTFFIGIISLMTTLWLIISVSSFFYPDSFLSNKYVLYVAASISFILSLINAIRHYFKTPIKGLEGEIKEIQKIALIRKPYWTFKLTATILKNRLGDIDRELDNVINNRKYIKIKKELDLLEYLEWVNSRPNQFLTLIKVLKQLLIVDLFEALNFDENNEEGNFKLLVNTIKLIEDFYHDLYKFEVEEKEIMFPELAQKLNSYQLSWVPMIRENVNQMMKELDEIGNRKRKDTSKIHINLVLESPDNIDDFIKELEKLYNIANEQL